MKIYFDHEKLHAYQSSLRFVRWSEPFLEKLSGLPVGLIKSKWPGRFGEDVLAYRVGGEE